MSRYRIRLNRYKAVEVSADGSLQLNDQCLAYARRCGYGADARVAIDQTCGEFAVFVGARLVHEGRFDRLGGTP